MISKTLIPLIIISLLTQSPYSLMARGGHGGGGHHGGGHHGGGHHGGHPEHHAGEHHREHRDHYTHHGHGQHHGNWNHGGFNRGGWNRGNWVVWAGAGIGAGIISAALIDSYYGGYYPHFGYGLGLSKPVEQTLVTYADNGQWPQAEEVLINRSNELQNQLTELQKDAQANRQQIIDIQDQLTKVQLHINAINNHLKNQQTTAGSLQTF